MKMNNLRLPFSFVLLTGILIFSSCKKEEVKPTSTPSPTPATPSNSFYAKVDGVAFQETLLSGFTVNNKIQITASENGSFPSIGFSLPNDITPGTYSFSGVFGSYVALYNVGSDQNDQYSAEQGTGTLTITTHDTSTDYVQGTFSFVASPNMGNSNTNTYNITEGSFTVNY